MASEYIDPVAPVILGVTGILFFAIAGRFAARKLGQPSALGEVIIGILIGMLGHYFGLELVLLLREGPAVFDIFNLESSIEEMQTVGFESGRIAVIGVAAPFALGFLAVRLAACTAARLGWYSRRSARASV